MDAIQQKFPKLNNKRTSELLLVTYAQRFFVFKIYMNVNLG